MYPFSPKLPSQPGCCMTLSRVPIGWPFKKGPLVCSGGTLLLFFLPFPPSSRCPVGFTERLLFWLLFALRRRHRCELNREKHTVNEKLKVFPLKFTACEFRRQPLDNKHRVRRPQQNSLAPGWLSWFIAVYGTVLQAERGLPFCFLMDSHSAQDLEVWFSLQFCWPYRFSSKYLITSWTSSQLWS